MLFVHLAFCHAHALLAHFLLLAQESSHDDPLIAENQCSTPAHQLCVPFRMDPKLGMCAYQTGSAAFHGGGDEPFGRSIF
jgi:hypothetical protein